MTKFGKTILAAASVATAVAAVPADARPNYGRHYDRHDGIDPGDVIAGALVIGGIAAIASAASRDGRGYNRDYDRNYDRDYSSSYDNDYGYYNNGYNSRQAVEQCVRAAQRDASRYGWARITDVGSIQRVRGGYEVRGRLVVEQRGWRGRDWRGNDDRYGYRYDRYSDGYDKGRFSCTTRYGQVADVRLGGLRSYYG